MKKQIIVYDDAEFANTGNIITIEFSLNNENNLDKEEMQNFIDVIKGHILSQEIYNVLSLYTLVYGSDNTTVIEKLRSISNNLNDDIQIVDIKRIATSVMTETIRHAMYKDDSGIAMLMYFDNTKGDEKLYSKQQFFLSSLLKHIIEHRPLCVKEGDLLPEIKKKEEDTDGNKYFDFLNKAILDIQHIKDERYEKKPIKEFLKELKISILDFEYIAV